jgi:hypothetical protein
MVLSLIYEFTVSGVDHSYAGNGGLECSNVSYKNGFELLSAASFNHLSRVSKK